MQVGIEPAGCEYDMLSIVAFVRWGETNPLFHSSMEDNKFGLVYYRGC